MTAQPDLSRLLADVDLVIPALEGDDALSFLTRWSRKTVVPFAFDPDAYAVSSSQKFAARLIHDPLQTGVATMGLEAWKQILSQ